MKIANNDRGLGANMRGKNIQLPTPRSVPLFNPKLSIGSNPRIKANLQQYQPADSRAVRAGMLETLNRSIRSINRYFAESVQYRNIRFSLHEASGKRVAVVTDTKTGRRIQQIPAEAVLNLAANLRDASGVLFNTRG